MQKLNQESISVNATDITSLNKTAAIRLLHVDDDASNLEVCKSILKDLGNFEIDKANCVNEALKKLQTETYDCIISDYGMPQKNGLDFLAELRKNKNNIPFILFTGKGREEVAIKALNLGADGYFNKQGSTETVYGELAYGIVKAVNHKTAQKDLAEAQALSNSVFNSTEDMIWSIGASDDFPILTYNKTLSDYFLKTQNLQIRPGMRTRDILQNEELAQKWRHLNERALAEGSFTIEYTTCKDPRVLELTFNVLKRGEEPFGISVFGKDITKRRKAEETILSAEAKFRTIFENVYDIITYVDTQGKILDVNGRIEDLLGYEKEEIVGKNFVKLGLVKFSDLPKLLKLFINGVRKDEVQSILQLELKHKNGSKVSFEVGTRFIKDKKGKTLGVLNIYRDISERKKAEQSLKESEQKFRKVFEIGHDAFLISNFTESTIIDVNESFLEMFEYTKKEVIGKKALDLGLWANQLDRERITHQLKSDGKATNLEICCRRKNGEIFPILLSVSLLQTGNEQLILSTLKDMSKY